MPKLKEFMTIEEAAEMLVVSPRWVQRKAKEKRIKSIKRGKRVYIPTEEVIKVYNNGC